MNASTTDRQPDIRPLMHKEVRYRYYGKDLNFSLSMGLFSSFDVDSGTRLFLQHIGRQLDMDSCRTLLDAGCGTGVIGIALKAAWPHLKTTAIDRDALALAAARLNARRNRVDLAVFPGLDVVPDAETGTARFDLILTNIPAKAGESVHRRFITNGMASLTTEGRMGIVVVDTLADSCARLAQESGAVITYRFDGPRHTVFILSRDTERSYELSREFPGAYLRNSGTFEIAKSPYLLETVYDLPGFDTVPFDDAMAVKAAALTGKEPALVTAYNPRQGHAVTGLLSRCRNAPAVQLVGRDLLALKITAANIRRNFPDCVISLFHTTSVSEIPALIREGSLRPADLMLIIPDPLPKVSWYDQVSEAFGGSDTPSAAQWLIFASKSSILAPFEQGLSGFAKKISKKSRGFKALGFHRLYF